MSLPKPYYQDDAVTIYHGDCREILPHLPNVDAVVTDPPYGIGEAAGRNRSRSKLAVARDYGDASWDDEPADAELIRQASALAKFSVVWGGNYFGLEASSCWLVWDKLNGESDFADCELAWTNLPGAVRKITYRWAGMLQQHGGANKEDRFHPTQKPVEVMRWCIWRIPGEPALILDPFMGSGTTLRAAKDLGRRAIGIEIEEKYCEIAARRMSQEVLPLGGAR